MTTPSRTVLSRTRRARGVARITVALAALVGLFLPGVAAPAGAAPRSDTAPATDRVVRDTRITESSGLVASTRHPGVLWTHNDSGNAATLYALDPDGSTAATVRISGVPAVDWEALAPVRGRAGEALLAVGDIGDNEALRSRIEIDLVAEPDPLRSRRTSPVRVLRLHYPDGPADAETLLSDPRTGRLYVVTKGLLGSTVYRVPEDLWPGSGGGGTVREGTLERIGDVSLSLVTDGCVLPDSRVLLRTYRQLAILPPLPDDTSSERRRLVPADTLGLPSQEQGEGLTVLDADTGVVALSSEGSRQPVLRLTAPASFWQAGTPTGDHSGTTGAGESDGSPDSGAGPEPTGKIAGISPSGDLQVPRGLLLAGLAVTVLAGIGLAVGRGGRH